MQLPRRPRRSSKERRQIPRWVVVGFLVVVGVLIVDGAYIAWRLTSTLSNARDDLVVGADALGEGRLDEASRLIRASADGMDSAEATTVHPAFLLTRILPVVGDDAAAVDALVGAGERGSEAALEVVAAAEAAGADERGLAAAFYVDGRVQFDALAAAGPHMERATDLVVDAADLLRDAPEPRFDAVRERFAEVQEEVESAETSARRGRALIKALPELSAQGSERRYLLAFLAPSEARGGGGLIGLHGVLKANDGALELNNFRAVSDDLDGPVDPAGLPEWYEEAYGYAAALREWRQSNFSPHFPSVAEVWLDMYEEQYGEQLDGVISMDPVAFGDLARGTGPITAEGSDVAVGPDNAAQVLMLDSYTQFESGDAQNAYLESLVRQLWDRLGSGDVDATDLGRGLADAVRAGHFKAFTPAEDSDALDALGLTGDFTELDPDLQMVFHNNLTATKIDYFLERDIATTVTLGADGAARVETIITLTNSAPEGAPPLLVGPNIKGETEGRNTMELRVLLPQGANFTQMTVDDRASFPLEIPEAEYPVVSEVVQLDRDETSAISVSYLLPDAFDPDAPTATFDLSLAPQAVANPDGYELTINAPYGWRISDARETTDLARQLHLEGTLDEARRVDVRLVPR